MRERVCLNCRQPIPSTRRADSRHCSDACRRQYQTRYFAGSRVPRGPQLFYVLGDGLVQIGLSSCLGATVRCLQAQQGSSVQLRFLGAQDGDRRHLARVHARFAYLRQHGRWFRAAPELLDFVARTARPSDLS